MATGPTVAGLTLDPAPTCVHTCVLSLVLPVFVISRGWSVCKAEMAMSNAQPAPGGPQVPLQVRKSPLFGQHFLGVPSSPPMTRETPSRS